ncbi:lipocalin family protein [Sphingobacterium hungaricum]|uniref:Lipocalin-like domain-containing protein n=1 Tax=Sphingobacterium hungaricum TaxID=2082723 RepID=A0A928UYU4_9SPHI|nr:lipocalin family protein [Sphingobacterium hungaricum]MBE8714558.1 hypothetical protein [Sphingobacterium hungaricum]
MKLALNLIFIAVLSVLSACSKSEINLIDNTHLLNSWQIDTNDPNPEVNPENSTFESFQRIEDACVLYHKFTFQANGELIEYYNAPMCNYTTSSKTFDFELDEINNKLTIEDFQYNEVTNDYEDVEFTILTLNEKILKLSYVVDGKVIVRAFKRYPSS